MSCSPASVAATLRVVRVSSRMPDLLLEPLDRVAECRWRHAQPFGGSGKAALLSHGQKSCQHAQFVAPPFVNRTHKGCSIFCLLTRAGSPYLRVMEIKRAGSQPSRTGPTDWFTGVVRIDPLLDPPEPARVGGASVTFEPGARTAWHTHPLGQTLIVSTGVGRAQRWGGPIEEIRPGDVVWFPPGEKHWHGASPTTAMTHIAIQEKLNGKAVEWMEHVSAEQYDGRG
jgi:quercetin dioxygenase-like cupin family protein